jgi:hypothetical protein
MLLSENLIVKKRLNFKIRIQLKQIKRNENMKEVIANSKKIRSKSNHLA